MKRDGGIGQLWCIAALACVMAFALGQGSPLAETGSPLDPNSPLPPTATPQPLEDCLAYCAEQPADQWCYCEKGCRCARGLDDACALDDYRAECQLKAAEELERSSCPPAGAVFDHLWMGQYPLWVQPDGMFCVEGWKR